MNKEKAKRQVDETMVPLHLLDTVKERFISGNFRAKLGISYKLMWLCF